MLTGSQGRGVRPDGESDERVARAPSFTNGFWADPVWLACSDGKARPTERGIFPLVDGLAKGVVRGGDPGAPIHAEETAEARAMRLKGYGNAIVCWEAAEFIKAFLEIEAQEG